MVTKKLENKVAIITGGSSGIGLATAKLFIEHGAYVFITGRRQDALDTAVKEINSNSLFAIQGDVSVTKDLDRLIKIVKEKKGRVDIYFANAGGAQPAIFGEITEEQIDSQFAVNVKGVILGIQKALPLMGDGSAIVINGSVSSSKANVGLSIYGATKGALRSLTRYLALELGPKKIRVNIVSPGLFHTAGHTKLGVTEDMVNKIAETLPLGRAGKMHEIANTILFLSCDDSSYMSGAELHIDGGLAQV